MYTFFIFSVFQQSMHCISRFIYCATEGEFVSNSTGLGRYKAFLCIVEEEVKGARNLNFANIQCHVQGQTLNFLPTLNQLGEWFMLTHLDMVHTYTHCCNSTADLCTLIHHHKLPVGSSDDLSCGNLLLSVSRREAASIKVYLQAIVCPF